MENSVRMMLMGVRQYPVLRVNNVMTTLHRLLEQNVLALMPLLLTQIIHDVLVSASNAYMMCLIKCCLICYTQISMNVKILSLLSTAHKSVLTYLVVMSVAVMMAIK